MGTVSVAVKRIGPKRPYPSRTPFAPSASLARRGSPQSAEAESDALGPSLAGEPLSHGQRDSSRLRALRLGERSLSCCNRRARDRSRIRCSKCGRPLPRPITTTADGDLKLVTGFRTSYRRMSPNDPAATITTASGHLGSDRTIHPRENRVLSPLECALLQTFPTSFKWGNALDLWGHSNVRAMIGEAVPPLFTRKHGRVLASLLREVPPRIALSAEDIRVSSAKRALRVRDASNSVGVASLKQGKRCATTRQRDWTSINEATPSGHGLSTPIYPGDERQNAS